MSDSSDWENQLDEIEEEKVLKEEAKKPVVAVSNKMNTKKVDTFSKAEVALDKADLEGMSAAARKKLEKVINDDHSHFNMEMMGSKLRSPICCILGHVDTGKTKILDKIRRTNVQGDEAGGITQQIGATFFPHEKLADMCRKVNPKTEVELPGLLIIDTPGHESFNNLRSRGTSLCDIAILVVDIMHGLEPQTRESIQLLKNKKAPFVIALNKCDRLFDWQCNDWSPFKKSYDMQNPNVHDEFDKRWKDIQVQLWEEELNTEIWWLNKDKRKTISVIPTSAHTGEGIPDLLFMLAGMTQNMMAKALTYREEVQCTLLEVKAVEGFGATIDVVLINGELHEGDRIMCCGMKGPIQTTIRSLLTPRPMKEIRVKGDYLHHKKIRAAMGIKIAANDVEDAVSGTPVFKLTDESDIPALEKEVMEDMTDIFKSVDKTGKGVYVQASTLGSLEALLQFLKDSNIPVFAVNIGPISKTDVKRASTMRDMGHPEFTVMLAFDVKLTKDAELEAKNLDVTIFQADIIYHLFDDFTKFREEQIRIKKEEMMKEAVFPAICTILPGQVFNKRDPIVMGLRVLDGVLKIGTPMCVPGKENLKIGQITSLEVNQKPVEEAGTGVEVAVKIQGLDNILVGRHFTESDELASLITRKSINCLKNYYKDEMTKDHWKCVIKLKKLYGIN